MHINYVLSIELDPVYSVINLPEGKKLMLPQDLGSCTVAFSQTDNIINMRFYFSLKQKSFNSNAYPIIKEYFKGFVEIQKNHFIVIAKS